MSQAIPAWLVPFRDQARTRPQAPALVTGDARLDYAGLDAAACRLAAQLDRLADPSEDLVALFGGRTSETYVALLGILAGGRGYVPLNPRFPARRSAAMLGRSGARTLIVSGRDPRRAKALLAESEACLAVLVLEGDRGDWREEASRHRVVFADDEASAPSADASPRRPPRGDDVAYLMFTSGSTGEPKGIAVTHDNVAAYLASVVPRLAAGEGARFSQTFDLTFDLSVHDLFVAWTSGACLHVPRAGELMAPAKFIRDHRITHWFSVPSVVSSMIALRMLRDDIFPSITSALFCGEALASAHAEAWQRASPNARVENLYGPTEATIAITSYTWDPVRSPAECRNGVVPIGRAFAGQAALVISAEGEELPPNQPGELVLGGAQIAPGYWRDPERSADRFVRLPGREGVWYRSGDNALRDEGGQLHFLGRLDDQVKIRGFRVELQEIEETLRGRLDGAEVVAIPWPRRGESAEGVVAFLLGARRADTDALGAHCRDVLPDYMVPRSFHHVDAWPLNANGKIDRKALAGTLERAPRSGEERTG